MTQRERKMLHVLLGLLGVVVAAGGLYTMLIRPLTDLSRDEEQVQESIQKKQLMIKALVQDRKLVSLARERSLPLQPHQAAIDYDRYLSGLLKTAGLIDINFQGPSNLDAKPVTTGMGAKAKKATQTPLNFSVRAKGTAAQVARSLELMQNTPVMHRVKRLTLDRIDVKDTTALLSVAMEVEALIVHNIAPDHKPSLSPTIKMDPPGTNPERDYAVAGKRNVFLGYVPPPTRVAKTDGKEKKDTVIDETPADDVDAREFVRLDHTVPSSSEAFIRNLLVGGSPIRIRPLAGFNTIKIWNESRRRLLVEGKLIRVDQRDVYFSVGEDVFAWHIGSSIAHAMRRPMSDAELREVGLLTMPKGTKKTSTEVEDLEP